MGAMAFQITGVSIVCSAVCSGVDKRKRQSSVSLAFLGDSIVNRWTPLTKGQPITWKKCFHLMTSS